MCSLCGIAAWFCEVSCKLRWMASTQKLWFSCLRNDAPSLLGSSLWKWMWSPRNRGHQGPPGSGCWSCPNSSGPGAVQVVRMQRSKDLESPVTSLSKKSGKQMSRIWITRMDVWTRSGCLDTFHKRNHRCASPAVPGLCRDTVRLWLASPIRSNKRWEHRGKCCDLAPSGQKSCFGIQNPWRFAPAFHSTRRMGSTFCFFIFWLVGFHHFHSFSSVSSKMLLGITTFSPLRRLIRPMLSLAWMLLLKVLSGTCVICVFVDFVWTHVDLRLQTLQFLRFCNLPQIFNSTSEDCPGTLIWHLTWPQPRKLLVLSKTVKS